MKKKSVLKGLTVVFVLLLGVLGIMLGIRANAQDEAGKITVSKTAVTSEDGRGADVTLEVNTTDLEAPTVDVVLVMDKSGSMDYTVSGGGFPWEPKVTRMDSAQAAAKAMVNALLGGENKENVRISYVTFSTGVETNGTFYTDDEITSLTNSINSTTAKGGTNLQGALVKADELLAASTASYKMVVVVTDGEPSFFTINGVTHGVGSKDAHETCGDTGDNNLANAHYSDEEYSNNNKTRTRKCLEADGTVLYVETATKTCGWGGNNWCDYERSYPNGEPMKPSEAAKIAADSLKENGAHIYAIGFGSDAASLGDFLTNDIASGSGFVYTATDTEGLSTAMDSIANEINNLLAVNAKVVDVVPKEFALPTDQYSMVAIDKEGNETAISNDNVRFVTCNEEEMAREGTKCSELGQTIIDLDMGNIVSTVKTYRITYHVDAKPEYSGAIYTNQEATFTATATEANTYYENKNINIPFDKPVVAIGAVTNDDDYTETPILNGATQVYDVMANDGEILKNVSVHYVNNAGEWTAHNGTTDVTAQLVVDSTSCGTASVTEDNKISYNSTGCASVNEGNVEIKYHVHLVVNIDGKETIIDSKDATGAASSTAKIKVNKVPTSYVVKYIDEDGNEVATEKPVDGVYVGDEVTEEAASSDIYNVDEESKTITLAEEGNEIVFNYTFKEVSYVVMGVDKISDETLYNDQTGKGKVTKTVNTTAQDIEHYDLEGTGTKELVLDKDVSKNVVVYYYLPRKTITTTIKVEGEEDQSTSQEYAYNASYTTSGLDEIPEGYELKETPLGATGNATEDKEIVYEYVLKRFNVTTVYEYERKDTVTSETEYKYGEPYETFGDANLAAGYKLDTTVGETKGTVKEAVTVTYKYVLERVTITTVCKYEGLEDVVTEKEYVYGDPYETSCEVNNNYEETEAPEEPDGTATEDLTLTYEYSKKEANLVVRYLEQGTDATVATGKNENVHWGDAYSEDAPTVKYYKLVSETSHYEGTILGDVTITFYYAKKDGGVTVNHILTGTDKTIADSTFEAKKYGEPYETAPVEDYRYTLLGLAEDSDEAKGTVEKDNVEVTYVYKQNVGTVKVQHLEYGTEKVLRSSEFTKNYGESYRTMDAEASLPDYRLVNQYPTNAQGTVNKELEVVTYYYQLRRATYVVKYLEVDTETELATPINTVVDYGTEYEATESEEVPNNYQLVEIDGDETKGTIKKPSYEIIYYYEKKNSDLETAVAKESTTEVITALDQAIPYTIDYSAKITDYIGHAVVTIVDELSYEIDPEKSELNGGTYDSEKMTITWVEEFEVDSYAEGENYITKNISKEIELVYTNLDPEERTVTNNIKANISLDNGESNNANEEVIDLEIEGIINVQYVDVETGEVLGTDKKTGLVGDVLEAEEKEIDGYTLTEVPEEAEYVYTLEEHDITYYYVKNQVEGVTHEEDDGEVLGANETNPKTGDDIVMFAILLGVSIAGIAITTKKIVNRQN